jgi:putative hemolysin
VRFMADPSLPTLLAIVALVILSSVFSASEAALLGLSRLRVLQRTHDEDNVTLTKILDERGEYLTTMLIGNTLVLLAAESLATWLAIREGIPSPVLVATLAMAAVVLFFGEILPKMVVVQDPQRWAPRVAWVLRFTARLLKPITWTLVGLTSFVIRLFGGDPRAQGPYVTEEDIRALVTAGEQHGAIEEEEKEMIHSIFELGDTAVSEVMTPRIDMVCAEADSPVSAAVDLVIKEGYSKLPVYEGTIDHIIGVVHDRELLVAVTRGEPNKLVRTLIRPVKAIPETKKVDELIREMQAEKVSVAIVVDEYGGTAGLVTMEDLLEEIVGEIMDEYDVGEHDKPAGFKRLSDGEVIVDARMSIADVNEELGLHLPTEDFDSIGGYAFGRFGRVPLPGDEVSIADGLTLVVEETAGRRLRSVRIKKAQQENGATAGTAARQSADSVNNGKSQ